MNYKVRWDRLAEMQLTALWLRVEIQQELAVVVEAFDRILQRDPNGQGESRAPGWRLAFYRPIEVLYFVDDTSRTVSVAGIKWVGR